jgi:hypothetical protein
MCNRRPAQQLCLQTVKPHVGVLEVPRIQASIQMPRLNLSRAVQWGSYLPLPATGHKPAIQVLVWGV